MIIVARHKVGNIDTWLKGHREREELFGPAISGFQTFQDTEDPNSIVLVIDVTDMEKFGAIMADPNNEATKVRHTVIEPVVMSMPVEL